MVTTIIIVIILQIYFIYVSKSIEDYMINLSGWLLSLAIYYIAINCFGYTVFIITAIINTIALIKVRWLLTDMSNIAKVLEAKA